MWQEIQERITREKWRFEHSDVDEDGERNSKQTNRLCCAV
jgi:hypothetical protein